VNKIDVEFDIGLTLAAVLLGALVVFGIIIVDVIKLLGKIL